MIDANRLFAEAERLRLDPVADETRMERVVALYLQAAEAGHDGARAAAALLLYGREGGQERAVQLWTQAARCGQAPSAMMMASLHVRGEIVTLDQGMARAYAAMLELRGASVVPQAEMDALYELMGRPDQNALTQAVEWLAACHMARFPSDQKYGGQWRVQLGAYSGMDRAMASWAALQTRHADFFAAISPHYEPVEVESMMLVRLQIVGFDDVAGANIVCRALIERGQACLVLAPHKE